MQGINTMAESTKGPYDRTIFYVSDGTAITAETFGHSLLSQFENLNLRQIRLPFIETLEKAEEALKRIRHQASVDGQRPIVFSTLVNPEINQIVRQAEVMFIDLFATFVEPLEHEFGVRSTHTIGRSHTAENSAQYQRRIAAINFSLAHDDGQSHHGLASADVILVGVSRCGKTPTSLYLAMQHGIKAANYPLIPEDFDRGQIPSTLAPFKKKCFGLTIDPERLRQIRHERRPDSTYASLENCRYEVREAEAMMRRSGVAWLSSTHKSIEEIATTILRDIRPDRLIY